MGVATAEIERSEGWAAAGLVLPPAYACVALGQGADAFAEACSRAASEGPGALLVSGRADILDIAVTLAPEEPLVSARRALFAGMLALAEAVGANGPSEMPVAILWPDTLLFDGARLGGGRLGWPADCAEDAVPDWLVFGATLIVSKNATDPGLTPESTALEEESFPQDGPRRVTESFARNLMKAFEIWDQDGFDAVAARYLAYLADGSGGPRRIENGGDCLIGVERLSLAPALACVAWRDPVTGGVRL